jgi:very-short-patch-repair endonuclease
MPGSIPLVEVVVGSLAPRNRCAPLPLVGRGWGWGSSSGKTNMSAGDQRVWAKRDRTIVPPHRRLARAMRATPTDAERKLWWHLRHRIPTPGTHFRRQVRIDRYIADFACHATRVVIEVDGGQHDRSAADEKRTKVLEANGYRELRYWNNEVLSNIDGVLEDILRAITTTPTPNPSPQGGGEHTEFAAGADSIQRESASRQDEAASGKLARRR